MISQKQDESGELSGCLDFILQGPSGALKSLTQAKPESGEWEREGPSGDTDLEDD